MSLDGDCIQEVWEGEGVVGRERRWVQPSLRVQCIEGKQE